MDFLFTLIDNTTGSPVVTIVQEPVGWDAIELVLKRDGFFQGFWLFSDQGFAENNLQFDADGYGILTNAYLTDGMAANVQLQVELKCADGDGYITIYVGDFDFRKYRNIKGDRCYVEIGVQVALPLKRFLDRKTQEVDLDSLASFDQKPVAQTIVSTCFFEAPNQIRIGQLLNGLVPGSSIVISGSGANNGTYTIASSKPEFQNVIQNVNPGFPALQTITVEASFNPVNNCISINQVVDIVVGNTITIAGTLSNNHTWTIVRATQYFNYTVFLVSGTPLIAETFLATDVTGTFIANAVPTSTIVTVAEAVTDLGATTKTVAASFVINNMVPYKGLNKIITLPAKIITATSLWKAPFDHVFDPNNGSTTATPAGNLIWQLNNGGNAQVIFTPDWPDIMAEIDETVIGSGLAIYPAFSDPAPDLVFFKGGSIPCVGAGKVTLKFSGSVASHGGAAINYTIQNLYINVRVGTTLQYAHTVLHFDIFPTFTGSMFSFNQTIDVNFPAGTYLGIDFQLFVGNGTDNSYPDITFNAGSFFKFVLESQCQDTPCSVYLINEAFSRCVESITNGEIRVYSDYFGRVDALPVASGSIGCGALEAITNGLKIRGSIIPDGSVLPKMTASFQDLFDAMNAIHNISASLEPDPDRAGKFRVRIEPFEFFYQSPILLNFSKVGSVKGSDYIVRDIDGDMLVGIFKTGYDKFETWNNNGLYDIFGARGYRTSISQLNAILDKTCKYIASDYAIEFTRRQYGLTSSDSRYDSNNFILCLKNELAAPARFLGTIECNTMAWYNPAPGILTVSPGDTIVIGASAHNNHTFTVVTATIVNNIQYIEFNHAVPVINEQASGVFIASSAGWLTPQPHAAVFVDFNGALVPTEPIFGLLNGDVLNISGTTSNNGTKTVTTAFVPFAASPLGILPVIDFPMFIFATTSFTSENSAPNCVIHDTTTPLYIVEQGMQGGTNILHPETVMNYRISPAHNALRWFKTVVMAYRDYTTGQMIFTDGTGNIYGMGQLNDDCAIETGKLSEGGTINLASFTNIADAKPLFWAELVKFEYPLTWDQFLTILANPYGRISFQTGNDNNETGWISELRYKPTDGIGSFTLRPKNS